MIEEKEITNDELEEILDFVIKRYGFDFSQYSKSSIKRRVGRIMTNYNLKGIFDLKFKLLNDESFFELFIENITVNVTEMFRDPSFYKALREHVLPQLESYPFIKIWHAGCSTGEEVYSMAILLYEAGLLKRTKQYATDLNPKVLKKAKEGIFDLRTMKEYTMNYNMAGGKEHFSDYYTAKYDHAIFKKELKKNMIFSLHNLVSDKSFNEFNLIICRNVLIYFNQDLQDKVIRLFSESLCHFGFLGLGSKESLLFYHDAKKFEVIDRSNKIFKLIK
jgi:chemotaxis protein methyltransferase CheR